jgi:hypothetical protein
VPFHIRGLTDAFQPELEGVRFLGILVQVLKIPAQCPRAPGQPPAGAGIHVAGGWRTCFPACHNRLIVLQTPSVAPPELNRRATHAGTAPGRRQFRFAGAPRPGGRRVAPPLETYSVQWSLAMGKYHCERSSQIPPQIIDYSTLSALTSRG